MLEIPNKVPQPQLIAVLFIIWGFGVLWRIFSIINVVLTPSEFPKLYTPFNPFSFPGGLLTSGSWNDGRDWHWVRRFQTYRESETVLVVPILTGKPALWSSNMDIGRQVAAGGHRSDFIKPPDSPFLAWGMNIGSADGSMWRKHRRIVGPAFGPELYKLVWTKTLEIYREMVEVEGWKNQNLVDIPVI
ncbi:hypothetical protein MSAN_01941700 [Mycena sanguinolenta]|uniref:Cytochrome P450 n=1 Tax=Mycena sanguinolenta TaxID=230812 RepID=A0A8H6XQ72_9AGAR|nr:hypothetical protein MSAN_01941700 [Mycena sanguinolenta]